MEPAPSAPVSIDALSVLYNNSLDDITRSVAAFDNAARIGQMTGTFAGLTLAYGDASPRPVLDDASLRALREQCPLVTIDYQFFDENTGTSRGQNRLSAQTSSDLLILCNPDVIPDGRAIWRLAAMFERQGLGLAEARQLPVEHPKDYVPGSGLTSWGSGAFSMVPRSVFEEVGRFDEDTFFLYCDDVDLSWRIREAGYDVAMQPAAVVFHAKSLDPDGRWIPTEAERYYSAEAALLLAYKWSRDQIVDALLTSLSASDDPGHVRAAAEFRRRRKTGRLPDQRDKQHRIGVFVEGNYARHRYLL